jgi:hypothetical protein
VCLANFSHLEMIFFFYKSTVHLKLISILFLVRPRLEQREREKGRAERRSEQKHGIILYKVIYLAKQNCLILLLLISFNYYYFIPIVVNANLLFERMKERGKKKSELYIK